PSTITPPSFFNFNARPPRLTLFPYTTLFRSQGSHGAITRLNLPHKLLERWARLASRRSQGDASEDKRGECEESAPLPGGRTSPGDRKSTRLNSSHVAISYAVFCLKKKKKGSR